MRFPRLALLTVAVLAHAAPLSAATVSIVQPAHPTQEMAVTLSRLRGELWSIGLAVKSTNRPPVGSPTDADAVVAMVGDPAPLAVEVWLAKPPAGQTGAIRITVEPDTKNASEMLALRTIEVLRANLVEVDWGGRENPSGRDARPNPPPATIPLPGNPAMSTSDPGHLELEAGAVVLTSLEGVGPALLPTLRAGWAWQPNLVLRVALAGFGTRPTIVNLLGSARIAQHYGLVGVGYRFRSERRLTPFLSCSLGALRTQVEGAASTPTIEGDRASQWSFLIDGGLGMELRLGKHTFATVGVHLQLAMPHVAIHLMEVSAATTGRPNVLFVLTMGAWR